MFQELEAVLNRLYPHRRWGEPDDEARFDGGLDGDAIEALSDELAQSLKASTFYREGSDEEYCDYIYVLCVGREPSLIQIRDAGIPLPLEFDHLPVQEQYLRMCVSRMAPVAGVQQTEVSLERDGTGLVLREAARAGVYDAPLLNRFRRLVAILPAYEITHLDFGEISHAPEGFESGPYSELYGGTPDIANYLFYPQPTNTVTTTALLSNVESKQLLAEKNV